MSLKSVSYPHRRSTAVESTPVWWHVVILHVKGAIVGGACIRGEASPWYPHFRAACMCGAFANDLEAVSIMLDEAELALHVSLLGLGAASADQTYVAVRATAIAKELGISP